jgi:lysozyme family protein
MPSVAFSSALPFVLKWEGGFVNNPNDPGGATNQGITQAVYDNWRARQGAPSQSVQLISSTEVQAIYESGYWLPARCDLLDTPLHLVQFDTAVNMGVGRSVRFLQQAVNCGVDGDFGPGTQAAVQQCDQGQTVINYCNEREAYYRALTQKNPKLAEFLAGWLNRLNALRKEAGLPGFESVQELDPRDSGYAPRIPDIGADPAYDL